MKMNPSTSGGNGSDTQQPPQGTSTADSSGAASQDEDEFYPLAVLIEELRNEDVRFRLNSIRRLSTIALALGTEKTRSQLIPFLTDSIYDVEDVMVAIADELGRFVPYVGGSAFAPSLINPLESLALVEDNNVREKAVQSLRVLIRQHSEADVREHVLPLVRRLATGDWYSSRSSACGLFAVVYSRLQDFPAGRQEILSLAQTLSSDDTPMVRRALSAVLGELALAMVGIEPLSDAAAAPSLAGGGSQTPESNAEQEAVTDSAAEGNAEVDEENTSKDKADASESLTPIEETPDVAEARALMVNALVPLFHTLAFKDNDQESVRLIALESCVQLARALGPQLAEQHVLSNLTKLLESKSWRCRCLLARKISSLQQVVPGTSANATLSDLLLSCLSDEAVETRCAAATQIAPFVRSLDSMGNEKDDFLLHRLLPAMSQLNSDANVHVKVKLGQAVLSLAPLLGHQVTLTHLLPLLLAQLKDDSPDVRLGVISSLDRINSLLPGSVSSVSSSLFPAIVELSKVPVWRVRLAVIRQMPLLAEQLGEEFFAPSEMRQHLLGWLEDAAFAVREAAVVAITRLTRHFGASWARSNVLTEVARLAESENYLRRMTALACCSALAAAVDAGSVAEVLLPTAAERAEVDRVPNVRFKAAQALAAVGAVVGAAAVMPSLKRLLGDVDADVRFYAREAIDALVEKPTRMDEAEEGTETRN